MAYDDVFRIIASRSLAVGTAGGAVASTTALSGQTYAVDLVFIGAVTTTAGVRFSIGEVGQTVNSTTSPLLPPNWITRYKCTPGQQIAALSNDATAVGNLTITELSK